MTPLALYEATRGTWKLGERRKGARVAFTVFEGVVREMYEIEGGIARAPRRTPRPDRFAGDVADEGLVNRGAPDGPPERPYLSVSATRSFVLRANTAARQA
jgi:hypothetical protein